MLRYMYRTVSKCRFVLGVWISEFWCHAASIAVSRKSHSIEAWHGLIRFREECFKFDLFDIEPGFVCVVPSASQRSQKKERSQHQLEKSILPEEHATFGPPTPSQVITVSWFLRTRDMLEVTSAPRSPTGILVGHCARSISCNATRHSIDTWSRK